jgi:hypothetical protein
MVVNEPLNVSVMDHFRLEREAGGQLLTIMVEVCVPGAANIESRSVATTPQEGALDDRSGLHTL